jgi:poly(3-hydroxybutyrate) depolymerase
LIGNAWNAGKCCLQPTDIDDVAFSRAMVDAIRKAGIRVNTTKVWVSGFSNGAMSKTKQYKTNRFITLHHTYSLFVPI